MKECKEYLKLEIFQKCNIEISDFQLDSESKEYSGCRFVVNGRKIISRFSKITPKKAGQFVAFYKRNSTNIIEPFHQNDALDLFIINCRSAKDFGLFIFPKEILIQKGIISNHNNEGKRAFRVYPNWDIAQSKQAINTQKWQLEYFVNFEKEAAAYEKLSKFLI